MKQKAATSRESHQKKPSNKGRKSLRGQPEIYLEKKTVANFTLTPFAKSCLNNQAREYNLSMSEFLERLIRWSVNSSNSNNFTHAHEFITQPTLSQPAKDQPSES